MFFIEQVLMFLSLQIKMYPQNQASGAMPFCFLMCI